VHARLLFLISIQSFYRTLSIVSLPRFSAGRSYSKEVDSLNTALGKTPYLIRVEDRVREDSTPPRHERRHKGWRRGIRSSILLHGNKIRMQERNHFVDSRTEFMRDAGRS
jgi:hypothetical protein